MADARSRHGEPPGPARAGPPILVSACLRGTPCTYKGEQESRSDLDGVLAQFHCVEVCPEVAGGLGVPRPRCEVDSEGRVTDEHGADTTAAFRAGAARALELARSRGVQLAVLKNKSPSCGCRGTYDGTHTHTWNPDGKGVTAALLEANGVECMTEDEAVARFGRGRRDG